MLPINVLSSGICPALGVAFLLLYPVLLSAQEAETLSPFDAGSISAFYRDPGIQAQAARFDLEAPAELQKLTLWLAGSGTGCAQINIYGNEGAYPAPLLQEALAESIQVCKDKPGIQKIEVKLPPGLHINRPQFFVVVNNLSENTHLLSDRQIKESVCQDQGETWTDQAILGNDGQWHSGRYSYAIQVDVLYPAPSSPAYFTDITTEALNESERRNALDLKSLDTPKSIAWGDIDQDGLLDILTKGRLWQNRGDNRFKEISDRLGISHSYKAQCFIDIDNDADLDILLLGSAEGTSSLLLNDGDGYFANQVLPLPPLYNLTTFAIADADADGWLDIFVGQGTDTAGQPLPHYLLRNTTDNNFTIHSRVVVKNTLGEETEVRSAQWLDYDGDNDIDIYVAGITPASNQLLLNNGSGIFHPLKEHTSSESAFHYQQFFPANLLDGKSGTSDWADYDRDNNLDLLQPVNISHNSVGKKTLQVGYERPLLHPYQEFNGGGTWADVNNDGYLDALVTSSCNCRFATLYIQNKEGKFDEKSFDYGLFRIPAGPDVTWADADNDGKIDLATFVNGTLHLYQNTEHNDHNFIAFDLQGSYTPAEVIGATVTLYSEGTYLTQMISSGRGALMQGPLRAHFGLGHQDHIDSAIIRFVNSDRNYVLIEPEINHLHRLFDPASRSQEEHVKIDLSVAPNPFQSLLTFQYNLPEKQHVRIEIRSLDGKLIAVPANGMQSEGKQTIEWRPLDGDGKPLATGTYIWHLQHGSSHQTGRAVLVH